MKIFDPIHGFIALTEEERALVDSAVFQRLRYIHQLGNVFLVYPGATHKRFEHSLGVMHLTTQLFDRISADFAAEERLYFRQILRLAALCHDLGHLPFSHTAEPRLLGPHGHEQWTERIIRSSYLEPVWEIFSAHFPGRGLVEDLVHLATGKEGLAELITGDLFGADRIDYLLRDAHMTGLKIGLFDYAQLIESLRRRGEKIVLEASGEEASKALLIARSFMHKRLYHYPPVQAYEFHLARFMQGFYADPRYFTDLAAYLSMSEAEIECALESAGQSKSDTFLSREAKRLKERSLRFQALVLPHGVNEEQLQETKEKFSIPDELIEWEFVPNDKNWLYLAPQYLFVYNTLAAALSVASGNE
jgi:HD superfamily phosphohydrolase